MTAPQKPAGPTLNIPAGMDPIYANLARISHSPADIVIDFAHLLPGETQARARDYLERIEAENEERRKAFADWCVDREMMAAAQSDALFMHCLPAHRGEEVEADVIDGPQSVVWDEAENRMHAQKAVMALTMR